MDEKMKLSEITNTIIYKEDKKEIKKQINDFAASKILLKIAFLQI